MNSKNWSKEKLIFYLESSLPESELARLEADLRSNRELREQIESLKDENQIHSVGEIWRRNRLSCPSRPELQQYQLEQLSSDASDYIKFHIEVVGCAICQANEADLNQATHSTTDQQRRRQIFESSAGFLKQQDES
ncbi:MAG: hypothetical protein P8M30_01010 [Planctomycetaceae bacterium]|jgi:hypothetical protein|nr:hypothetical protein [Planctomycetaceae bacterium]